MILIVANILIIDFRNSMMNNENWDSTKLKLGHKSLNKLKLKN